MGDNKDPPVALVPLLDELRKMEADVGRSRLKVDAAREELRTKIKALVGLVQNAKGGGAVGPWIGGGDKKAVGPLAQVPRGWANHADSQNVLVRLEAISAEALIIKDKAVALIERLAKRTCDFREMICQASTNGVGTQGPGNGAAGVVSASDLSAPWAVRDGVASSSILQAFEDVEAQVQRMACTLELVVYVLGCVDFATPSDRLTLLSLLCSHLDGVERHMYGGEP